MTQDAIQQVLAEWDELCHSTSPRTAMTRPMVTVTRFMRVGSKLARAIRELTDSSTEMDSTIKVTSGMRRPPDFAGRRESGIEWLRSEVSITRENAGSWFTEALIRRGEPCIHQITGRSKREMTIRMIVHEAMYEIWIN